MSDSEECEDKIFTQKLKTKPKPGKRKYESSKQHDPWAIEDDDDYIMPVSKGTD